VIVFIVCSFGGCLNSRSFAPSKGKKRQAIVDTLGLMLGVAITPADVQDRYGFIPLLRQGLSRPLTAPDTTPSWISTPKLELGSQAPRCVLICTVQLPSKGEAACAVSLAAVVAIATAATITTLESEIVFMAATFRNLMTLGKMSVQFER
jgi:hypothetical protein